MFGNEQLTVCVVSDSLPHIWQALLQNLANEARDGFIERVADDGDTLLFDTDRGSVAIMPYIDRDFGQIGRVTFPPEVLRGSKALADFYSHMVECGAIIRVGR